MSFKPSFTGEKRKQIYLSLHHITTSQKFYASFNQFFNRLNWFIKVFPFLGSMKLLGQRKARKFLNYLFYTLSIVVITYLLGNIFNLEFFDNPMIIGPIGSFAIFSLLLVRQWLKNYHHEGKP